MTILPLRRASSKSHSLQIRISVNHLHYLYLSWLPWALLLRNPIDLLLLLLPIYPPSLSPFFPANPIASSSHFLTPMAAANQGPQSGLFHDWLPTMAHRLGGEGLIGELCSGFNLLMDREKGVIDFESLKRNAAALGLGDLTDEDLRGMLREGDFDGDGALNQMEFCVLMFRLSPELMHDSWLWLEDALSHEFKDFC